MFSIASASASFRALPVPAPPAMPLLRELAFESVRTFVPRPASRAVTEADEPCPSATIEMTAATPITMPSVVRIARPLFARSASSAEGMLWVKRSPPRRRVGRCASTPKVARPVGDTAVAGDAA